MWINSNVVTLDVVDHTPPGETHATPLPTQFSTPQASALFPQVRPSAKGFQVGVSDRLAARSGAVIWARSRHQESRFGRPS